MAASLTFCLGRIIDAALSKGVQVYLWGRIIRSDERRFAKGKLTMAILERGLDGGGDSHLARRVYLHSFPLGCIKTSGMF